MWGPWTQSSQLLEHVGGSASLKEAPIQRTFRGQQDHEIFKGACSAMKLNENVGTCGDKSEIPFSVLSVGQGGPLQLGSFLCAIFIFCFYCVFSIALMRWKEQLERSLSFPPVSYKHLSSHNSSLYHSREERKTQVSSLISKWVPLPLGRNVVTGKLWSSPLHLKMFSFLFSTFLHQVTESNGMAGVSRKWWELPPSHRGWA